MNGIRFDTLDKKPKLYSIAFISAAALVVLIAVYFSGIDQSGGLVNLILSFYVLACIVFLIRAFIGQLRYNPYSYNTIYYFGFALFLVSVFFTHFTLALTCFTDPFFAQYANLTTLFGYIASSASNYMIYTFPLIAAFSVALVVSNVNLIRHEGRRFVNILGILLAGLLIAGAIFIFCFNYYASGSEAEVFVHDLVTNVLSALYLYFESMVIGAFVADMIAARYEPDKDRDFIIILGCRPRNDGTPTPLLKSRIDRAANFYKEQVRKTGKPPVLIPSGGQGSDEKISESLCMKNYLLSVGIPEKDIIMEDQSTNTFENMTFSKKIIYDRNPEAKIAFSTTNYHVFRSGMYSRRIKMRSQGMGAPTKWWFWPNAAVREFVGLLQGHKRKQIIILSVMIAVYVISTILVYPDLFF